MQSLSIHFEKPNQQLWFIVPTAMNMEITIFELWQHIIFYLYTDAFHKLVMQ